MKGHHWNKLFLAKESRKAVQERQFFGEPEWLAFGQREIGHEFQGVETVCAKEGRK